VTDLKQLTGARTHQGQSGARNPHLRHAPTKVSKSRIKRLRGLSRPQYRLRTDTIRVSYDVTGVTVEILAIVLKEKAQAWLAQFGNPP